jgi:type II secretory pathway component GspD/PulD (secretin)
MSWSPDGRSMVLTIADIVSIVSGGEDVRRPDVYRLDLPDRLIDASAAQHEGPPMGRDSSLADQTPEPSPADANGPPASARSERAGPADANGPPASARSERAGADGTGYVTEVVKPLHMTIGEAVGSLSPGYDQYFTLNVSRNLMLFKGPPEVLESLRSDLQLIDTNAPHILVDMLAVELSEAATRVLGLDWSYAEGHFAFFQPTGSPIQQYPRSAGVVDAGFPSGALDSLVSIPGIGQSYYQGVGDLPREFFIRLNTLVEDGEGKILANPRTVAMSGKESLIQIRKTLNYFFNEGFDVSGRPIVKKSDISADTEGRILPTLLEDGRIHLMVDAKVGSFRFTKDAGLPELTTRQSTTEVTVEQGQTLVLGGLRQQEINAVTTKVPILGDIPIIKALFRHEEKVVRTSVLTIFITPQVLKPGAPAPDWPEFNAEDHRISPIMETEGLDLQDGLNGLLNHTEE